MIYSVQSNVSYTCQFNVFLSRMLYKEMPFKRVAKFETHPFTDCLSKNSYNEEKCQTQIDALYACCNQFYEKNGDDAKVSLIFNLELCTFMS